VLVRHGTGHAAALAAAALPVTAAAHATREASGTGYRVRSGDTLSHIAARHGVSVAALRAANGLRSTRLRIGQKLVVPRPITRTPAPVGLLADAGERVHVVRASDTVWELARHYGVSTVAFLGANELEPRAVLRLGQRLRIPAASARSRSAARLPSATHLAHDTTRYEVQAGDSLWTISRRFKVSVDQLRRWNDLGGGHRLHPGQHLVIDGET
jgi:membrane-bound lytic murein transglycosylase D